MGASASDSGTLRLMMSRDTCLQLGICLQYKIPREVSWCINDFKEYEGIVSLRVCNLYRRSYLDVFIYILVCVMTNFRMGT